MWMLTLVLGCLESSSLLLLLLLEGEVLLVLLLLVLLGCLLSRSGIELGDKQCETRLERLEFPTLSGHIDVCEMQSTGIG